MFLLQEDQDGRTLQDEAIIKDSNVKVSVRSHEENKAANSYEEGRTLKGAMTDQVEEATTVQVDGDRTFDNEAMNIDHKTTMTIDVNEEAITLELDKARTMDEEAETIDIKVGWTIRKEARTIEFVEPRTMAQEAMSVVCVEVTTIDKNEHQNG